MNTTREQNLQTARELLYKAKRSADPTDAWVLIDFLWDQMVLEDKRED